MSSASVSVFALPERLGHKLRPELIGPDGDRLNAIRLALDQRRSRVKEDLAALRSFGGRRGRAAADRDREIHRLTALLQTLQRHGTEVCLGRMVGVDDPEPVYVGRIGLSDSAGNRLLVDWRTPAAEPFFAATMADPLGLASRRRYRWMDGLIRDYWDEAFGPSGTAASLALDDESAFIASLATSRSARMRDVLATIQADQDVIIRASSRGALVVEGGPGTGKTVVALHRAAYLLYSDVRLNGDRGGLLFVGPNTAFLDYIGDILPSLGEHGVQTCTLRDLTPEGATAANESEPVTSRLKATARIVDAIEPAVAMYEEPPTHSVSVETYSAQAWLSAADWAEAFATPESGVPHNEGRILVWESLLDVLVDKCAGLGLPEAVLRSEFDHSTELREVIGATWPVLDPAELVGDLWSVPAYLRRCAPWLSAGEAARLQRADPYAWTVSDLPLLDAARRRIGDPQALRHHRRKQMAEAQQREYHTEMIGYLLAADDDPESSLGMLEGSDLREVLLDREAFAATPRNPLDGPFAHIIVDEAQELTDAEWRMLLARCPSGSFTIVGDRAQARHGFPGTWLERLEPLGLRDVRTAELTINYRTPAEIMAEAAPAILDVIPDAKVPTSIRRSGRPIHHGAPEELPALLQGWLAGHPEGTTAVIGLPSLGSAERVHCLSPAAAKGLEFDLVILVNPQEFGDGIEGAVDRYVAMTRATQQLAVLTPTKRDSLPVVS